MTAKKQRKHKREQPTGPRRCEDCGAILRSGNTSMLCAPCQSRPGWHKRIRKGAT